MDTEAPAKTPSQRILDAMGGIRPAAKLLNKSPTTVQYWYDQGIPQRHQQLVLETCLREGKEIEGVPVAPSHFFNDAIPDAPQPQQARAS